MLRLLTAFFALLAAAASFYAWQEHTDADTLRAKLSGLESERDAARKAEGAAQKEAVSLQKNNADLLAERAAHPAPGQPGVAAAEGAPATDTAKSAPGGGFSQMAKMFQSEDGKKMMKTQMAMVTKMQYADLARVLNLSPQEAEQVMSLLTDRQTARAGDPWKIMADGELSPEKLKKLTDDGEATRKDYDEKLKAVLGPEKMQELQDYDHSLGERMMLTQFDQSFSAANAPLQGDQRDQLLQIMTDERKNSPAPTFDRTGADAAKNMELMMDDAAVEKWTQQEADYQRRVLQNAPKILNPDQVNALQQAFQQSTEMQKFGMKMGREMMKSKGK